MKRATKVSIVAALVLVLALGAAYFIALRLLKSQIEEALGPQGEIEDIRLSLTTVEIKGLKIRAAANAKKGIRWPAEYELQAARVVVTPNLRSLLSDTIHVQNIRVEQPKLPVLRTAQELLLVPSLLSKPAKEEQDSGKAAEAKPKTLRIAQIELVDGEVDFYDASVGRRLHKISLTGIDGHVDNFKLPALDDSQPLEFRGHLPANGQSGEFSLAGNVTPANLDSSLRLALRDVPLATFQPYFVKTADTQVRRGTMDLDLDSKVKSRHLHAPGKLRLQGLELSGDGGFAGLTRQAAVSLIKDRRDRIDLQFTLEGNLDDPRFSLNEQFYVRVGAAIAESLGLSVESLGKGAGGVAQELGGAIKKLFGK